MTIPVWTTVAEMRSALAPVRAGGERIVLVPTMGDLHEGHLSLVRAGLPFGRVVVSIFVNPTQFAPGEDYESYPRRLEGDLAKLEPLGVTGVFAPAPEEMYPQGESTRVEVRQLTEPLCGAHREGHFLGVTTICTKLFVTTGCDLAVFGQKDAQQCLVIRRLVLDLGLSTDLLFAPTVREAGGVAMSSRNRYLEGDERERARALSGALAAGRSQLEAGERRVDRIEVEMARVLRESGLEPDYAELRTIPDLLHPELAHGRMLLAGAAYVGRARLIDNLCLEVGDEVSEAPLLDDHAPAAVAARWANPMG
jgi:pantoate--beta-alanine ligase